MGSQIGILSDRLSAYAPAPTLVPSSMTSLVLRKAKDGVETEHLRFCTVKTVPVLEEGEWKIPTAPHMPVMKSKLKGKGKEERWPRQLTAAAES